MAGGVAADRFDDSAQERLGRVEAFLVGVEPPFSGVPKFSRGKQVAGGVRTHASFARGVAGKRLEAAMRQAFDDRQARLGSGDFADPIRSQRRADDFEAEIVALLRNRRPTPP